MRKTLCSAAFVTVLCLGGAASAQDTTIRAGKEGAKIHAGGTRVEAGQDGRVIIQAPNAQIETGAHADDSNTANTAVVSSEGDSELDLTGDGQRKTLSCNGDTEVSVTGSSNDYTFKGVCKSVEVTGSSNKVSLDVVGELEVTGTDNTITWRRAKGDARKPKISSTGSNNTVRQAK